MFVEISAGSSYGRRYVAYKVDGNKLSAIVADSGHDNLAGNGVAEEFLGLTTEQAKEKVNQENDEQEKDLENHSFDGCHACYWSVRYTEIEDLYHYSEDELR